MRIGQGTETMLSLYIMLCNEKVSTLQTAPDAECTWGGKGDLNLTAGSRSLCTRKNSRTRQKETAKHSTFIKVEVCTQEVGAGLREQDVPVGSGWKVIIKRGKSRGGRDRVILSF